MIEIELRKDFKVKVVGYNNVFVEVEPLNDEYKELGRFYIVIKSTHQRLLIKDKNLSSIDSQSIKEIFKIGNEVYIYSPVTLLLRDSKEDRFCWLTRSSDKLESLRHTAEILLKKKDVSVSLTELLNDDYII